ncbi:hypothetical protein VIGAN_04267700 [Vigna angularis var. angularis]|uniref:Pectinesterase catalytic domain-containing protein n=1 Tax=Vigna angularis var. angularis TaxID=157739 RepID=A0A0S3RX47_PHAAN|nr:hypothetical protein VIGAN_04267700 [Vigna angularis var. angularis]
MIQVLLQDYDIQVRILFLGEEKVITAQGGQVKNGQDFIFGDTIQVLLQDYNIQVRIRFLGEENVITAQGRQVKNDQGDIVIQTYRIGATPEFEVVKQFSDISREAWKNYSRTIIKESSMTDTTHSTGWLEWKSTSSTLNTLFYREYNNVEPGAESTKRVN